MSDDPDPTAPDDPPGAEAQVGPTVPETRGEPVPEIRVADGHDAVLPEASRVTAEAADKPTGGHTAAPPREPDDDLSRRRRQMCCAREQGELSPLRRCDKRVDERGGDPPPRERRSEGLWRTAKGHSVPEPV